MIWLQVDKKFGLLVQLPPGSKPHPHARCAIATGRINLHPNKGGLCLELVLAVSHRTRREPLGPSYS